MSPTRRQRFTAHANVVPGDGGWKRVVGTVVVVLLLLYAGVLLLSRTDGFRHVVEQHLRAAWGTPELEIDRAWCDLMLRLVLEGIRSEAAESGLPGFEIQDLNVSGVLTGRWSTGPYRFTALTVRGVDADLVHDANGPSQPTVIADFAKYIGARIGLFDKGNSVAPPLESRHVRVLDANIRWRNAEGQVTTRLEGVHYETEAARLLGQTVRLEQLTVDYSLHAGREERAHTWTNLDRAPAD